MTALKEWLAAQLQRLSVTLAGGSHAEKHVAVLIDADSFAPRLADPLFAYANALGQVVSARLYANFAAINAGAWSPAIKAHGLTAMQHFSGPAGRNGADIALTIDAVDMLYTHRIDRFVIVTSDSDFVALAHRLRRAGAAVHGVGPTAASTAFKTSCTIFVEQDQLGDRARSWAAQPRQPARWSLHPADAEELILCALVRLGGARSWVAVNDLDLEVRRVTPGFDPRVFRRHRLPDLLKALDSIELSTNSKAARVRLASPVRNGEVPRGTVKS